MRNYSNSLRQTMIVLFVSYQHHFFIREVNTNRVVEREYAVDVYMQSEREIVILNVPFVELHMLLQMKSYMKSQKNE